MAFRRTVVYDGACGFCIWSCRLLRRILSYRLRFVPYQHPFAARLLPQMSDAERARSVWFLANDEHWPGAEAVAQMLLRERRWRPLARLYYHPLLQPLADWAYELIASNRYDLPGNWPQSHEDLDEELPSRRESLTS